MAQLPASGQKSSDDSGSGPISDNTTLPLMGQNELNELNESDSVACKNLEVFQAMADHIADPNLVLKGTALEVGQLGIRCIHCKLCPTKATKNYVAFPSCVGRMAQTIRNLASHHLSTCEMAPMEVHESLHQSALKTGWEQLAGDQTKLHEYCTQFCRRHGLIDKSAVFESGIIFDISQSRSQRRNEPGTQSNPIELERSPYFDPHPGQPIPITGPSRNDPLAPIPVAWQRDVPREEMELHGAFHRTDLLEEPDSQVAMAGGEYRESTSAATAQSPRQTAQADEEDDLEPLHPTRAPAPPPENVPTEVQYDVSSIPYFRNPDGSWQCKYCSHFPPEYRCQLSVWIAPDHGPPPQDFTLQHLSRCSAYNQNLWQEQMYQSQLAHYSNPVANTPFQPAFEHRMQTTPIHSSQPVQYLQEGMAFPPHQHTTPPQMTQAQQIGPDHGQARAQLPGAAALPLPQHAASPQMAHQAQRIGPDRAQTGAPSPANDPLPTGALQSPPFHAYEYAQYAHPYRQALLQQQSPVIPQPETPTAPHLMLPPGAYLGGGRGAIIQPPMPPFPHAFPQMNPTAVATGRGGSPQAAPAGQNASVRHAIEFLSEMDRELRSRDARGTASLRNALKCLSDADKELQSSSSSTTGQIILEEDKQLLTDYFYHLMKQLRICRFSESDRKSRGGKRLSIKIGYGGLQCIHCAGQPYPRKFFWSNVDRLANSFAEISGHLLKCLLCPQEIKDALYQLKQVHPDQISKLPRGSQKVFFRRMWRRLHGAGDDDDSQKKPAAAAEGKAGEDDSSISIDTKPSDRSIEKTSSDESPYILERSAEEAAKLLGDSAASSQPPSPTSRILLAIPEDKEWLSDIDCFIRRQIEVFCATDKDVATAKSDHSTAVYKGQVGMRCVHCGTTPKCKGVSFPRSIDTIHESVREIHQLHLDRCEYMPIEAKSRLSALKGSTSLSSVLRKYYIVAAKALGLKDSPNGIRAGFGSGSASSRGAFAFMDESSVVAAAGPAPEAMLSSASPKETSRKRKASDDLQPNPSSGKKPAKEEEKPKPS